MRVSIQYPDLVLLGILCSLLLGVPVGYATAVWTAITVPAALIGIALIYQATFRGGPVESTEELTDEAREGRRWGLFCQTWERGHARSRASPDGRLRPPTTRSRMRSRTLAPRTTTRSSEGVTVAI